jgi:hypothetical protein
VDHFDAKLRHPFRNRYGNLVPALRLCNGKKSNLPSPEASKQGLRFLNPRKEADYNEVIFEDPQSHELKGTTPIARYHILKLGLNDPLLTAKRRARAEAFKLLSSPTYYKPPFTDTEAAEATVAIIQKLRIEADAIPMLKPPPPEGTAS